MLGFENEACLLEPEIAAILWIHKSDNVEMQAAIIVSFASITIRAEPASITAAPITILWTAEDVSKNFTLATNPQ